MGDTNLQLIEKLKKANKLIEDQKFALDASAIVAITDSRGVINYVNNKFEVISGYSSEELIGKTHKIINSAVHDSDFFAIMWKTISSGVVWQGEVCNRAKNGELYWVDTTIVPFLDENNRPYQYIAIRADITHKKKSELVIARERGRMFASEKMASLGILSSGLSHELGNPLGALRGRVEMLQMQCAKETLPSIDKLKTSTDKMMALIDRMSKIIRGLRAYARDGSQDPYESVDFGALITDILEISSDRCKKHEVELRVKGVDQNILVLGREAELGQVIVNLLNNAIDATLDLPEKWVGVELYSLGSNIQLVFRDSGSGIPNEIINKVFDPFYTSKGVGKGTGLGLSICKSIVEAHKGSINIRENEPNTCFEIILPKPQ